MVLSRTSDLDAHAVVEAIPHIVWVSDSSGAILRVNRSGAVYLGVEQERLLSWGWFDFVHPDDRAAARQAWAVAVENCEPYESEYRLLTSKGWRANLSRAAVRRDESGQVLEWVGTCTDVQALREAQFELRQEQREAAATLALLQTLMATSPVGAAFVDRDLRFVHINERLAAIDGLSVSDHLGRSVEEVVPGLWDQIGPSLKQVLAGGPSVQDREIVGETPTHPGVECAWLASFHPVRGPRGIEGVGVVVLDITERRQMEEQLRCTQRLDAIGRLSGGIAHDLNNILVPIFGYLDMHLRHLPEGERLHTDLTQVRRGAQRAADLAHRVLALGRNQVSVLIPISTAEDRAESRCTHSDAELVGSETILVAEDNPAVRRMVCEALEEHGYRTLSADSPLATLDLARAHTGSIELVLTDLSMPGLNGCELSNEVRKQHPAAAVLIMSGHGREALSATRNGSSDLPLLVKPFAMHDLLRAVRAALVKQGSRHAH